MVTEHQHDYRPAVAVIMNEIRWERRLTMNPLYPFTCMVCSDTLWCTAQQAVDRRLISAIWPPA